MKGLVAFAAAIAMSLAAPLAADDNASRPAWVTLGTSGGPPVRVERAQISNALVLPDGAAYLFDAGNGVQRQMARADIPETSVKAVFLTHHHLDHVADLGPLLWTHWSYGKGILQIVGPQGTKALVDALVAASAQITKAAYFGAGPGKPTMAEMVAVTEIPADLLEPREVYHDSEIAVSAVGVDHYPPSPAVAPEDMPQAVAFRVVAGGRTIVYSGDSGPSRRLSELAKGADLLVSEVIDLDAIAVQMRRDFANSPPGLLEGVLGGMSRSHLTAEEVGRVAAAGNVGEVLLTHFVPIPEVVHDRGDYARGIAEHYRGPVILADDLGRY